MLKSKDSSKEDRRDKERSKRSDDEDRAHRESVDPDDHAGKWRSVSPFRQVS